MTNHDALERFAERYDLEILGTVLPDRRRWRRPPGRARATVRRHRGSRSAGDLRRGPRVDRRGDHPRRSLGVDVVTLYTDSLGEEGSGAETYPDLMRFDARAIADALNEG